MFVKNKYNKIDILHLDCEGMDHVILLSTDFSKIIPKPKYILYENGHIPENDKKKLVKHLNKYNYIMKQEGFDVLVELQEQFFKIDNNNYF